MVFPVSGCASTPTNLAMNPRLRNIYIYVSHGKDTDLFKILFFNELLKTCFDVFSVTDLKLMTAAI